MKEDVKPLVEHTCIFRRTYKAKIINKVKTQAT